MDKKTFIEAIQALKALPKRKFKQTYDFIVNLKQLDLKKPEEQVETWVKLPFDKGKPIKIGALVGPELQEAAKANCDLVIMHDKFPSYAANKKEVKKIAGQYDYFIAQANIMPDVAKTFGRVFGPRGKMPNPKAGCVVPPNANLKALAETLRKTIKVSAKLQPSVKVMVGKEDMPDEQIADNMLAVYSSVLQKLPQEKNNIKTVMLKLSMSQPVTITDEGIKMPKQKTEAPAAKEPKPKKAKAKTEGAE
jgi:large subunit ribosomal protein L1